MSEQIRRQRQQWRYKELTTGGGGKVGTVCTVGGGGMPCWYLYQVDNSKGYNKKIIVS
jgi:hypothetical protein|tara:strand:+ start:90 stop:263 length:174 start_codon:yes stop_codon:yes gene_type:complete